MQNWEKIIEIYKKYTPESGYMVTYEDIYQMLSKTVINEVMGKWDYEKYETEQRQFVDMFRKQFVSFLFRVKHWTQEQIKTNEYLVRSSYAADWRIKQDYCDWKGSRDFDLWLLATEGADISLSTKSREEIFDSQITVSHESNISLEESIMNLSYYTKGKCFAYLMYLYKDKENKIPLWLKVGKTEDIRTRQKQLVKQYNLEDIEVIKTFEFEDGETAEMMESFMRKYYKAKYQGKNFTPKDRFEGGLCEDRELKYFEKKARLIAAVAEL